MQIIETDNLNQEQKEFIFKLWNQEYPKQLKFSELNELDLYLSNLQNQFHYLAMEENNEMMGWAFIFERENEKWFAMILDCKVQRKGWGTAMLKILKEKEPVLNGWVTNHNKYTKQNGEIYPSPLSFYLKNDFVICDHIKLETEILSAIKIKWVSDLVSKMKHIQNKTDT